MKTEKLINRAADNERFGASGAVTRPKGSADFEVLFLVSSVVEAPPSPSRHYVVGNAVRSDKVVKSANDRCFIDCEERIENQP